MPLHDTQRAFRQMTTAQNPISSTVPFDQNGIHHGHLVLVLVHATERARWLHLLDESIATTSDLTTLTKRLEDLNRQLADSTKLYPYIVNAINVPSHGVRRAIHPCERI